MTDRLAALDLDRLDRLVSEGFISRVEGPDGLCLFNYTQQQQYKGSWDDVTLNCRGIVLDPDGRVQSRPFAKFFNVSEHDSPFLPDLPAEPFEVYEKLDGSLIVASALGDDVLLTSRGSFTSDHAIAAKKMWDEQYADIVIPEGQTWCFELIAPWNRIVVDYGGRNDLVLLAAFDNETGRDLPLPEWPGPIVRTFDGLDDFDAITARLNALPADEEGYVLRFAGGMRAKAKGIEYVRLHKLITGVSARTIWECHANGVPLDEIVERVPDEFFAWVTATSHRLLSDFVEVETLALAKHDEIVGLPTRKDQALAIKDFEHRSVVFSLLDGKPHAQMIWKNLKPAAERPYKVEVE